MEGDQVWQGQGNINKDPLFVRKGVFDVNRTTQDGLPNFIVDPGDYHLQPGSPCIDSGTLDGAPTTDIEGKQRPCGEGVDMGAYEFCAPPEVPFKRGDANADGERNARDAVFILTYLFGVGEELSCVKSADANDSRKIDITDPVYLLNFLFAGGPQPAEPLGECGFDPTIDELSCESFEACE